jgi:phosphoserine phosphatase
MQHADTVPVLVFDLDETVLSINSFPRWVSHLIIGRLPGLGVRRRVLLSLRVSFLLLRRKIGSIDHRRLLQLLQTAWQAAATDRAETIGSRFRTDLMQYVRPNLQSLLTMVAAGQVDAILATAALSDYADGLGREFGFRNILMTPTGDDPTKFVNSGTRKRDRVLDFLKQRGWVDRPLILFTDHLDDLPLIRESSAVCWFGSREDLATADAFATDTCFVFSKDESSDRLCAIVWSLADYAALVRPKAGREQEITVS